ncbi:MAG: KpsF/GutQ family sugar-phosphate isomerase [Fimbriimonas sp.]
MSLESGRRTLLQEAAALETCAAALDARFDAAVELVLGCTGRVVTCGVGKSGHIARKTAGTLSSTGSPSLFLHAAEAVHGDLGSVTDRDVVLLYSHSGETDEIVRLFPSLRDQGAKTILITGRANSSAGRLADLVLDTRVTEEACPNDLAPTTSTTVMLALSDALAIAVMERRGFGKAEFARFHPMGSLGRRLLLRVTDVMRKEDDLPLVSPATSYLDVSRAITRAGAGAACVVDEKGALLGLITDGDLRRHLQNSGGDVTETAASLMTSGVTTIEPQLLAVEALEVFQNHPRAIGEIPVIDGEGKVLGILMLKDLLRAGIV